MRNRFPVTLWLTLVALVAALALPARANTWPLPPPGSRLVGHRFLFASSSASVILYK